MEPKKPRNGRSQREKGNRFERELVDLFRQYGLESTRVPLSGATDFAKGDVVVQATFGDTLTGECKRRKNLPEWIVNALGEHNFMAMRADRGECLVVITAKMFAELLQ